MSVVQRVIILNRPFKIRGFTIMQWIVLAISVGIGLLVATKMPGMEVKVAGAPLGVFVFVAIVGSAAGWTTVVAKKPMAWWRNKVLYNIGAEPTLYLPKREECQIYPDPTIKDVVKREDQPYISADSFR